MAYFYPVDGNWAKFHFDKNLRTLRKLVNEIRSACGKDAFSQVHQQAASKIADKVVEIFQKTKITVTHRLMT